MGFKTYLRIRTVSRLEYLVEFLKSVDAGYDREDARHRIWRIQEDFEVRKAKVLGKQKPRRIRGASIVPECERMALQLKFAVRANNHWSLTPDGERFLESLPMDLEDFPSGEARKTLITRLWQIYPRFGQTVLAILSQPEGEMVLPLRSAAGSFREIIKQKYQLDYDVLIFNMIREIGTQLELLNWHIIDTEDRQLQCVYAIVCAATLSHFEGLDGHPLRTETPLDICLRDIGLDIGALTIQKGAYAAHTLLSLAPMRNARSKGYLVIDLQSDCVFIQPHGEVDVNELEQVLWEMYLEKVDYRPRFPALYPELRNAVCRHLRISDKTFDRVVKELIKSPQRIRIYPSGGVLDYASPMAHRYKYIPPITLSGRFMTYLKIDRNTK